MARMLAVAPFRMILAVVLGGSVVIGMAVAMAVGSGDPVSSGLFWGISVGIPLAAMVISLAIVVAVMQPWRYLPDMDAMRAGGSWVHWSYDEAGWQVANRIEGARTRRSAFTAALAALGIGVVVLLIGLAIGGENGSTYVFAGGLTAGIAVTGMAAVGGTSPALLARRRKRGDIYISRVGIYRVPGGYTPMAGFGYRLENLELRAEPSPYLSFEVLVQGRGGATKQSLADVAVPPGREAEARALVERVRTEILGRTSA
jgi:hypothetical protein